MRNSVKSAKYFLHGKEVRPTDLEVGKIYDVKGKYVHLDQEINLIGARYIGLGCFRSYKGKAYNTISEEKTLELENEVISNNAKYLNISVLVLIPKKGGRMLYNATNLKTRSLFYLNEDMNKIIQEERKRLKSLDNADNLKKKKKLSYAQVNHLFKNEIIYLSDYKEINFYKLEKDSLVVELVDNEGKREVNRVFNGA